ncbi:hypothetical protein [Microbacterium maritypicum]
MSDLLDKASKHKFPHRDVPICTDPDLIVERDQAMARVATAKSVPSKPTDTGDDRMVTSAPTVSPQLAAAVAEVKRINDEIQAATIVLRITGVNRVKYNRFMLANPPRKGRNEAFDPQKFFPYVARQTAVYVDNTGATHEITPEEWERLDDPKGDGILGDGEFDRIAEAIIEVNRTVGATNVSFFANGSETTPDSSETSA